MSMFAQNSATTRNLILNRFKKACLKMYDIDFSITNDVVEAKLCVDMSRIYNRNEQIIKDIVDTMEDENICIVDGVVNLLEVMCRRLSWYTIVCLCIIIEAAVRRNYEKICIYNHINRETNYIVMNQEDCEHVAQLVATETSKWTEEQWWLQGFMNKFQPNAENFEERIFTKFFEAV